MLLQLLPPFLSVRIAPLTHPYSPLGQRRRDPILPARPLRHQHYPRPRQLPHLPQRPVRYPHRRQGTGLLQTIHPVRVQLVGLVDLTHHHLGFARMHQPRLATGLLDLVDDPIPVRRRFDRHRRAAGATRQSLTNRTRRVLQPILLHLPCAHLLLLDPRVALVTVKCDIFFHGAAPCFFLPDQEVFLFPADSVPLSTGVALSYSSS